MTWGPTFDMRGVYAEFVEEGGIIFDMEQYSSFIIIKYNVIMKVSL